MDRKIVIESKIDAKVFLDFSFFNCFKLNFRGFGLLLFPIAMFVFAGINLYTGSRFLCILFCISGVVMPSIYLLFYKVSVKNQIRRFKLDTPHQIYTITVTNDGVHVNNEKENAIYKWDQVYRVYITEKYMYIYITKALSFILPYADITDGTKSRLIQAVKSLAVSNRIFTFK